jgi:dTDP-4-dehydrorhamnose reductase
MKIAIMGSNGFIGNALYEYLKEKEYEVIGLSKSAGKNTDFIVNLEKYEEIDTDIFSNCQYLIFAAAISSIDLCEEQKELCYRINVEGTKNIISKALSKGLKVIFFSSDAVYGVDRNKLFDEKSDTNPISNYGKMKREIEIAFKNEKNFISLRLAYVFSYFDKFTRYFISCIDNKKESEIFHPFYRNVVCIDDVLAVVEKLICKWMIFDINIINVCGIELVSRIAIADTINRILNCEYNYKIVKKDNSFFNVRPKVTQIKSLYLKDILKNYDESFYEKAYKEIKKYR